MSDITLILQAIENGETDAADRLLPIVYGELRRIASAKMVQERSGHTLQATALVHEAYLRLVGSENRQNWEGRGHFFAAAAEAMRRILVESARRKRRHKRGGGNISQELRDFDLVNLPDLDQILDLDEALKRLSAEDSRAVEVAKLRIFAGFTLDEAATALGVSLRTAKRDWAYARAFLSQALSIYRDGDRS